MNMMTAGEMRAAKSKERKGVVVTAEMARAILLHNQDGLFAVFPGHKGDRSKKPIDLSFLLKLDIDLRDAFAEGYVMHCLKKVTSADRRYDITRAMRTGLMAYLAQPGAPDPKLSDIDERFLHRFKAWLDDKDRDGFTEKLMTRAAQLAAVQMPLKQLMASREWKPKLSAGLRTIERPYAKLGHTVDHKEVLKEAEHERLYVGAANDIAATVERLERQWARMGQFDGATLSIEEAGASPEACAAWLDANFEHPVPSRYILNRLNAAHIRFIPEAVQVEAERILYPDLDEIVPMLLIVCAFFALNPSAAFKLRKNDLDYSFEEIGDVRRLKMFPNKKRAGLRQRNTVTVTEHPDNPGQILRFLERRTRRLDHARPDYPNRAFVRFSFEDRSVVPLNTSDKSWKSALKRFADRHQLPEFTIDQLRPTTLDLVHELSGGNIIAMQGVATHTTAQTGYTFYTSDAQKQRNRQTLGEMMMQMERSTATGGLLRPEDRPPDIADQGAATPGFTCLDPKDSPIPGEVPGELCTAYGRCPECPLAVVDPTSPRALAYLAMLNKRITDAQDRLDPLAWHMRWAPVQEELLTYWLQGWSPDVIAKSRETPIPELPHVE